MLEKIVLKIEEDAKKECKRIIEEAKAEKKKIVDSAKPEIEKEKRHLLEQGKSEAYAAKQRLISESIVKARHAETELKNRIVSEVISLARDKMEKLSRKEYSEVLSSLLSSAGTDIEGATVYVKKGDKELVKVKGTKIKERDMPRGIIIETADSTIDLTFPALFERKAAELRMYAGRKLFK